MEPQVSSRSRATRVAMLASGILLGMQAHEPMLLDATARELLHSTAPIADILPGQSPAQITANATIAVVLCIAGCPRSRRVA